MAELKVPQISAEDALQWTIMIDSGMYPVFVQPLLERFGLEETQRMLQPGVDLMNKGTSLFAQMVGIEGNDAIAISSLIRFVEERLLKCEGKIIEVSPNRVVAELNKCPFQTCSPDFCRVYDGTTDGMVKAMNPDYKFHMTKMMSAGDPVCQWVVEKK
jgi:predicted hydrocarbon binding protein